MNEYRITAKLGGFDAQRMAVNVGVRIERVGSPVLLEKLNAEVFTAILKP